jgi:hypothetical protein
MLLVRYPVGVVERGMTGLATYRTVSLVDQPSMTIMTRQRQFLESRHPCKMVSLSRVTLQPVLWKNTSHLAACVAQDGDGEEIVDKAGELMGWACFRW